MSYRSRTQDAAGNELCSVMFGVVVSVQEMYCALWRVILVNHQSDGEFWMMTPHNFFNVFEQTRPIAKQWPIYLRPQQVGGCPDAGMVSNHCSSAMMFGIQLLAVRTLASDSSGKECSSEPGVVYAGDSLIYDATRHPSGTAEDCAAECINTQECNFFTFFKGPCQPSHPAYPPRCTLSNLYLARLHPPYYSYVSGTFSIRIYLDP